MGNSARQGSGRRDSRGALALFGGLSVSLLAAAGCVGSSSEEDLQALLDDGDVTTLSSRGLTVASGSPTGHATVVLRGSGSGGKGGPMGGGAGGMIGGGTGGDCIPFPDGSGGDSGMGGFFGGSGGSPKGGSAGFSGSVDAGSADAVPFDAGSLGGFVGFDGGSTGGTGMFMDGGIASGGAGGAIATDGGQMGGRPGGRGGAGGGQVFCPPEIHPLGSWTFEDCNMDRTDLFDSSPTGHTAFRSVSTACGTGIEGQGITFKNKDDLVFVPDQPDFIFRRGVTVASWVRPTRLDGAQSLFRKRESGTSSFLLLANGRRFQFIAQLPRGPVAVSAPAKENVWTHVAGTYDGTWLRLYINGVEAAKTKASGAIVEGTGPLLIGNDADQRLFRGDLDNVFFDTRALSADGVLALTCIHQPSTVTVTPVMSAAVPPGTTVPFDIALTNHNTAGCPAETLQFFTNQLDGFTTDPSFSFLSVPAGTTQHVPVSVTSSDEVDPGATDVSFQIFAVDGQNDFVSGVMTYVAAAPSGCHVTTSRELMIRDLSVVDDSIRTGPESPTDPRAGAWSFARLMENIAPSPEQAPAMVEQVLSTWLSDQVVNGFTIPARPQMQNLVLSQFPRLANGSLDLSRAPVRLLAIVNRVDLRNLAQGNAGEGRLVFGVLGPGGFPLQFTMIFEFKLPATTPDEVMSWSNRWHALGAQMFPSEGYNAALQAITDAFSRRGAAKNGINGSALGQFRTNEIALSFEWQFREFNLSATTGLLVPATIKLTPDRSFNGSQTLADYVNANEAAIIAETHDVPLSFEGAPFLTGSVVNDLTGWFVPGVNPDARFHFSLNTCNGCHSAQETNTIFLQISPRDVGQPAILSPFLTGTTVFDPFSGQVRTLNDLRRRNQDLTALVCPPGTGTGTGGAGGGSGGATGMGGRTGAGGVSGAGGRTGSAGRGGVVTGSGGNAGMVIPPAPPPAPVPAASTATEADARAAFIAKGISRVH